MLLNADIGEIVSSYVAQCRPWGDCRSPSLFLCCSRPALGKLLTDGEECVRTSLNATVPSSAETETETEAAALTVILKVEDQRIGTHTRWTREMRRKRIAIHPPVPMDNPSVCTGHRLVGLVVKASASRAEGPGFESRLSRDFFGAESYQ